MAEAPRHGQGAATGAERERILRPVTSCRVWRDRAFTEIKRSDIARLLDATEDAHGHWVADSVLSVLRALSSWYATRARRLCAAFRQEHAAHPSAGPQAQPHPDRRRAAQGLARQPRPTATFMARSCGCRCSPASARAKTSNMRWDGHCRRRHVDDPDSATREGQPRRAATANDGDRHHQGAAAPCW